MSSGAVKLSVSGTGSPPSCASQSRDRLGDERFNLRFMSDNVEGS